LIEIVSNTKRREIGAGIAEYCIDTNVILGDMKNSIIVSMPTGVSLDSTHQLTNDMLRYEWFTKSINNDPGNIGTIRCIVSQTDSNITTATPNIKPNNQLIQESISELFEQAINELDFDTTYDFLEGRINRVYSELGFDVFFEIESRLLDYSRNPDFIRAILIVLGKTRDEASREIRLQILLRQLDSVNVDIRDGALTGLSFVKEHRALKYIQTAYSLEKINIIRLHFKRVLSNLR
jgi:hypothetical protein